MGGTPDSSGTGISFHLTTKFGAQGGWQYDIRVPQANGKEVQTKWQWALVVFQCIYLQVGIRATATGQGVWESLWAGIGQSGPGGLVEGPGVLGGYLQHEWEQTGTKAEPCYQTKTQGWGWTQDSQDDS